MGTRGSKAPLATRHDNASGPSGVTAWTAETARPEGSGGTHRPETTILSVGFLMFCWTLLLSKTEIKGWRQVLSLAMEQLGAPLFLDGLLTNPGSFS